MLRSLFSSSHRPLLIALMTFVALITTSGQANCALLWNWSYSGPSITAAGTFTTVDTPDSLGFYLITGITGTRNGETITGLQPTDTPIPGNEPFNVDNLVRIGTHQLTGDGFGYSTSGGNYASPFFADFLPTPGYMEVFSAPPLTPGFENLGPEDSELEITFSATPVPEPQTALLLMTGLMGMIYPTARRSYKTVSRQRPSR